MYSIDNTPFPGVRDPHEVGGSTAYRVWLIPYGNQYIILCGKMQHDLITQKPPSSNAEGGGWFLFSGEAFENSAGCPFLWYVRRISIRRVPKKGQMGARMGQSRGLPHSGLSYHIGEGFRPFMKLFYDFAPMFLCCYRKPPIYVF